MYHFSSSKLFFFVSCVTTGGRHDIVVADNGTGAGAVLRVECPITSMITP
jgi:hypothetical protein